MLVNVDCEWNLAIRRMWAYYEKCGCAVEVRNLGYGFYPHNKTSLINGEGYALVCVSNIFETNAHRVEVINCNSVYFGGVGSRDTAARLPAEIETTPPKYTDGETTAHGFITRGCIRNYFVECHDCFAKTANFGSEGKAESIVAWNTRAERTCEYVGDDISGGCSVCRGWLDPACAYCPNCGARVVEHD